MKARFEIFKGKDDQFYWRLKAANHEIILKSEGYTVKQNAYNGIASVKENAPHDERYERKIAKNGEFMFNLKAVNNQIIGTSETYKNKQGREGGIIAVKREAPNAPIVDLTAKTEEAKTIGITESTGGLSISGGCATPITVKPKGGYFGN